MDKLIFKVIKNSSAKAEKFFNLHDTKTILLINKLYASFFEGYYHATECRLIRNGQDYDHAYIRYNGTHDSGEYFFGFGKIYSTGKFSKIEAKDLEIGDILEIENISGNNLHPYADVAALVKRLDIFQSMSESFDELAKKSGAKDGGILLNSLLDGYKKGLKKRKRGNIVIVRLTDK